MKSSSQDGVALLAIAITMMTVAAAGMVSWNFMSGARSRLDLEQRRALRTTVRLQDALEAQDSITRASIRNVGASVLAIATKTELQILLRGRNLTDDGGRGDDVVWTVRPDARARMLTERRERRVLRAIERKARALGLSRETFLSDFIALGPRRGLDRLLGSCGLDPDQLRDGHGRRLRLRSTAAGVAVASAGRDGRWATEDDVVLR